MTRFNLTDVTFADKSAEQIETELVSRFEQAIGTKLSPADPRRIFLQTAVTLLVQQRVLIDYSAKQNLLAYATGSVMDHIGASSGTTRLPAAKAKTTIRFTLSISQQETIPTGTRVTAGDGLFFATTVEATAQVGDTIIEVEAECSEGGTKGNGYLPGQINQLVDPLKWVQSAVNITTSEGGADIEDDDSFAERIRKAPESFSVAGPSDGYAYWARTASAAIADVSVSSPSPGVVEIRPLLEGGAIPTQEVLELVEQVCSDRRVRPLTDRVQVAAPEVVNYDIAITYWITTDNSGVAASIQTKVQQAVLDYQAWQSAKLGRAVDPSELIARVKIAGAKRVACTAPLYTAVGQHQVAVSNAVTLTYGGLEND